MNSIVLFAIFPVLSTIAGAALALVKPPGPLMRSFIQHFAAGVVFSVVGVELLPDVVKRHAPPFVILGFVLGMLTMLGIKMTTKKLEDKESQSQAFPTALIIAVSVDVLLDGFLIGIGFAAGAKEGFLLTAGLTLELLSLGLAVAFELANTGMSRTRVLGVVSSVSALILFGALVGGAILAHASDIVLETMLSFGLVALLFLVTEELLTEAHEHPETPITTSAFFVGFLIFLIMGMLA